MTESVERERLEVDILFVGAGVATLASAIHLADLCRARNQPLPSILVIEKSAELGAHQLSGAMMDPRGIAELMPDFLEQGFPFHYRCTRDVTWFMTARWAIPSPVTPPPFMNHGNYAISISDVVKWLGTKAEARGIEIYPGFPAARPIFEGERVVGVQIADRGVDRHGKRKPNFEAGAEIRARCVVLGEGARGSCAKVVIERLGLAGSNPQAYETGVKEIWRVRPERHVPGRVVHTMGWPHDPTTFGGGWIYDLKDDQVSIGFVTGLDYDNPHTDPHDLMQRWKTHPRMRALLEGGECLRYGAKTMPVGGWFSFPKPYADGLLLIGDAAGTCNGERLKGVHLAIKSGMLAAQALAEAIERDDYSAATLGVVERLFRESWLAREHYRSRNFHGSFQWVAHMPRRLGWIRQLPWLLNGELLARLTGGRGLVRQVRTRPDHEHMMRLSELTPKEQRKRERLAYDNRFTFDKVTAVALAGSRHEVDQPPHLKVLDPEICATRCVTEYGNPCEHFCPAAVYEMVPDESRPGRTRLMVHHENCVHCKTCDIADPYAIITWTTPEGGDGPDYTHM